MLFYMGLLLILTHFDHCNYKPYYFTWEYCKYCFYLWMTVIINHFFLFDIIANINLFLVMVIVNMLSYVGLQLIYLGSYYHKNVILAQGFLWPKLCFDNKKLANVSDDIIHLSTCVTINLFSAVNEESLKI